MTISTTTTTLISNKEEDNSHNSIIAEQLIELLIPFLKHHRGLSETSRENIYNIVKNLFKYLKDFSKNNLNNQ